MFGAGEGALRAVRDYSSAKRSPEVSAWFREGLPVIMISRQPGHANPQITLRMYAHLVDHADLHQLAAVFDR